MTHHIEFRVATASDADAVAALHADSWRRHYRGAYSDAYLDGDILTDRSTVWTARLGSHDPGRYTVVACDGPKLIGFAHVVFREDPTWGTLLDNLHVAYEYKRQGIGSTLVARAANAAMKHAPDVGLYLWVHEENINAQAFYQALGGKPVERAIVQPPGGVPDRLCGSPTKLRFAWPDPSPLAKRLP